MLAAQAIQCGDSRRDRRRRHREHVGRPLPAAQGPHRLPHGKRRGGRLHDPRRPLGRVQQLAHGHLRRPLRQKIQLLPAGTGRFRRGQLPAGRSTPRRTACSPRRSSPSRSPAARAPSWRGRGAGPVQRGEAAGLAAGLRPAGHGDGGQRLEHQRRRRRGGGPLPRKGGQLGVRPQARILGYATVSREPEWFTLAPIAAIGSLMKCLRLSVARRGRVRDQRGLLRGAHGGHERPGHPARDGRTSTAARSPWAIRSAPAAPACWSRCWARCERRDAPLGIASLCIGGGEAVALAVQRI